MGFAKLVRDILELMSKIVDGQVFLAVEFFCWLSNTIESLSKATMEHISSCRVIFCPRNPVKRP